jgi:hypothetical protein
MLTVSNTSSKPTAPSPPGQSGVPYRAKTGVPSVPSHLRRSSAGGAPLRKSSQTMAPPMLPHWNGSPRGTVSITYAFWLTTYKQMALSSDSTTLSASLLSRPAMATPPTGPPLHHSFSGPTIQQYAKQWATRPSTWPMASNLSSLSI